MGRHSSSTLKANRRLLAVYGLVSEPFCEPMNLRVGDPTHGSIKLKAGSALGQLLVT